MEEVKLHNKEEDAWCVLKGKVYDFTRYISFHPGGKIFLNFGKKEIMRAAGKDATKLFGKKNLNLDNVHSWVNPETLLDKCIVGYLKF